MDFLNIDSKIEMNLKQLSFYYDLYQKLQNKFSFFVILYSFIFIYFIELTKYALNFSISIEYFFFLLAFVIFLFFLIQSIYRTYLFLKPTEIMYVNQPSTFYNDIFESYKSKLETDDESILNEYIKLTYLSEVEIALTNNFDVFKDKNNIFYHNFISILYALILYVILSSFVIFEKKEKSNVIEIQNFKEIINHINQNPMANQKPKTDPKMVIITKPVTIKQSSSISGKTNDSNSFKVKINSDTIKKK